MPTLDTNLSHLLWMIHNNHAPKRTKTSHQDSCLTVRSNTVTLTLSYYPIRVHSGDQRPAQTSTLRASQSPSPGSPAWHTQDEEIRFSKQVIRQQNNGSCSERQNESTEVLKTEVPKLEGGRDGRLGYFPYIRHLQYNHGQTRDQANRGCHFSALVKSHCDQGKAWLSNAL